MEKSFRQKNKGFTLIELLVVVAIIGLLSSVVMASLQSARSNAQNTAKNRMVSEYVTALELYRDSNPSEGYPVNGYVTGWLNDSYKCLGLLSSEKCLGNNSYKGDEELNTKIKTFIPGPPKDEVSIPISTLDMKGIGYKCVEKSSSGFCSKYSLQWYLIGDNQDCINGAGPQKSPQNVTLCKYPIN